MTGDLVIVACSVLAVVAGLALLRAWLRDFSALLWMLALRPALTIASVSTTAAALCGLSTVLLPSEGYAATRVLALLLFAPPIARPLADAVAWAMAPQTLRAPIRPVVAEIALQSGAVLLCATLMLLGSVFLWPGPLWHPARVVLAVLLSPLPARALIRGTEDAFKWAGDRRSTRDFIFDQAAHDQQAAFVSSLTVLENGPLSDAGEMFGEGTVSDADVPESQAATAEPVARPRKRSPRATPPI